MPRTTTFPPNLDELTRLATHFRKAMDQCDRSHWGPEFETFPRGACGDTTLMLGRYLKANGMGRSDYVLGRRRHGNALVSHAWAQIGDVIIDITADQFAEIDRAVIVTHDDRWHGTFDREVLHEADFSVYGDQTPMLHTVYATILREARSCTDLRAD